MKILLILGVIAALIAGLLCLPLSLRLRFLDGKLSLRAAVWFVTVFRYPKKPERVRLRRYRPRAVRRRREKARKKAERQAAAAARKERKKPKKKSEPSAEKPAKKKKAKSAGALKRWLPVISAALKKLKKVLRTDVYTLVFTAASGDPDKTARLYGAAAEPFLALTEHMRSSRGIRLHRSTRVALLPDFQKAKPSAECDLRISVTVGGVLSLIVTVLIAIVRAQHPTDTDSSGGKANVRKQAE